MNMAKSRNQKGKILVIEHLLQGTGEGRIVTMQEILDKLLEYGITAERKSIYDDIEALREFGLDVQYKRGRPGGYYLAGGQEIAAVPESVHTKEEAGISKNAETEKKSEPVIIRISWMLLLFTVFLKLKSFRCIMHVIRRDILKAGSKW